MCPGEKFDRKRRRLGEKDKKKLKIGEGGERVKKTKGS